MTLALILFGLNLKPLYDAIAQVESDRGATSANIYQIRNIYVEDINRISNVKYSMRDVLDRDKAEMMMYRYWQFYGAEYRCLTGKNPTYETLARIHNGGPYGWRKDSTVSYWKKVNKVMKEMKHDNRGSNDGVHE